MADLRRNSGLKTEVVDEILRLFPELNNLTPGNKANPPLNEWGSDDWLAFITEYTKYQKVNDDRFKRIEALKKTLSESLKQSSRGDGRFGLEAAPIKMQAVKEERWAAQQQAVAQAEAAWAATGVGEGGKAAMPKMNNMEATAQNTTKKSSANVPMGAQAGVGAPSVGQVAQNTTKKTYGYVGVPAVGQVPQGYEGQVVMSTQKEALRQNKADASTGGPPMDITPIVTALTTLNNTLIGSLASIESRARNNDINPALTKMNSLLSQINSSLPDPIHGGGDEEIIAVKKAAGAKMKKKGKSKKKPKGKPTQPAAAKKTELAKEIPGTLGGVITVLSQINTTLQTSLAAIETRLKNNDVNLALTRMTDFLSEINDSLPEQAGGGTRRSRMKKRNETLRHRRT